MSVGRLNIAQLVETSGCKRVRKTARQKSMYESCVTASYLHLQLQLVLFLCHAYFTVPLHHQVSTVSLFRQIFLAHVVDFSVLYSEFSFRLFVGTTCIHILHSYRAIC